MRRTGRLERQVISTLEQAALTTEDVRNLYAVLLGREPESEPVVRQMEGRLWPEALGAFLGSDEFREAVFAPTAEGRPWDDFLFRGVPTDDQRKWVARVFLDGRLDELSLLTWPMVLQAVCRSEVFMPERLPGDLDAFLHGLAKAETRHDADVALIDASELFDHNFYMAQARISLGTRWLAAKHYSTISASRRLWPSREFNPAVYLEMNPDVREQGLEPLLHYLKFGWREKRSYRVSRAPYSEKPVAPSHDAWLALTADPRIAANAERALHDAEDVVDIVVPVYRGLDDTLACLHSVLVSRNDTAFRLLVVDDCSPEPALSQALDELAALGLFTLMRNERNLGFVGTVNRGMALSRARDVLLLNSDTVVYGDWLDRLRRQAYSSARVATVTPLSNNATIFSYPRFAHANNHDLEIPFAQLDALAADVNRGLNITVPTGVGFCFYIRRAALDELGLFDELLFGKGYGEENDFCMRAIEHAWDNIAALDVFVRHTGEVSFASNAASGKRDGFLRLTSAHPRYEAIVHRCVERDAFRPARENLDVARFAALSNGRGILMVEHGWGGGIERHIKDLVGFLGEEGVPTLLCTPLADRKFGGLRSLTSDEFPNLPGLPWHDTEKCAAILASLRLRKVHIHSVAGIDWHTVEAMRQAFALAGLEYVVTLHDYLPVCPRITMIDWGGSYCDSPSTNYCGECIARAGTPFGEVDIVTWRRRYAALIDGAEAVIVPDRDMADRIRRYMGAQKKLLLRPHPALPPAASPRRHAPLPGIRRIGVFGAIGEHKGSRTLRALCIDALERELPLRFQLYGYTDRTHLDTFANLDITGPYVEEDLPRLVDEKPCDLALFLSVCPETFGYTLDYAFAWGIFPVALDIGAPARRIREAGFGSVIPLPYVFNPQRLNDRLLAMDIGAPARPVHEQGRTWESAEHYYRWTG
ncbi:MAG: glycosyltransferase [Rhizorhabdus sp.]